MWSAPRQPQMLHAETAMAHASLQVCISVGLRLRQKCTITENTTSTGITMWLELPYAMGILAHLEGRPLMRQHFTVPLRLVSSAQAWSLRLLSDLTSMRAT